VTHTYFWHRPPGASRKGQPCRLVASGRKGSVLLEFEDGWRMVTSRRAIRKIAKAEAGDGQAECQSVVERRQGKRALRRRGAAQEVFAQLGLPAISALGTR